MPHLDFFHVTGSDMMFPILVSRETAIEIRDAIDRTLRHQDMLEDGLSEDEDPTDAAHKTKIVRRKAKAVPVQIRFWDDYEASVVYATEIVQAFDAFGIPIRKQSEDHGHVRPDRQGHGGVDCIDMIIKTHREYGFIGVVTVLAHLVKTGHDKDTIDATAWKKAAEQVL